jgi:ATP-dependent helicase HrpA
MQIGEQVKHLARYLPDADRMCLNYRTLGSSDELRRHIVNLAADRALFGDDNVLVRRREEFVQRAERAWQRLSEAAREASGVVGESLELYQMLQRKVAAATPPLLAPNVIDIRQHLSDLMPPGFVAATPWPWLRHFPRYLRGIELRYKKLTNAGATRDTQAMNEVRPLWKRYVDRRELHEFQGVDDPNLVQYRWLIEELRISLFAQELKTSVPVSAKRLDQLWRDVK